VCLALVQLVLSLVLTFTVWTPEESRFYCEIIIVKPVSFGHGGHFPMAMWGAIKIILEYCQSSLNNCSTMSLQHICSLSGAFHGKSWPVSDHRPHRDMLRICCSCIPMSTVICGSLRSLAVNYRRNEIFERVENHTKAAESWLIPEHRGHVYVLRTDIPLIVPDLNHDAKVIPTVKVRTRLYWRTLCVSSVTRG